MKLFEVTEGEFPKLYESVYHFSKYFYRCLKKEKRNLNWGFNYGAIFALEQYHSFHTPEGAKIINPFPL